MVLMAGMVIRGLISCPDLEHVAHELWGRSLLDGGHTQRPPGSPPEGPADVVLVARRSGGVSWEED